MERIAIIVQGPVHPRTRDALAFLNRSAHRKRLHIICVAWSSEPSEIIEGLGSFADRIVCPTPQGDPGTCHRNWQVQGVHAGLQQAGCGYVLKCRSDLLLSNSYLDKIAALADANFDRLCVVNIYTRREPFHVSDFLVFGRKAWVAAYFQISHYQDLFSPEVEFARCYVRTRGLPYAHTLEDYLRFLRDEVELVDFIEYGLTWFKQPNMQEILTRHRPLLGDRDVGPVLAKVIRSRFMRHIKRCGPTGLALTALGLQLADPLCRFVLDRVRRPGHSLYWVDGKAPEYVRPLPRESVH